jgi:hypothetical protein
MWKLMRGKRGSNGEESVEVNERRVKVEQESGHLAKATAAILCPQPTSAIEHAGTRSHYIWEGKCYPILLSESLWETMGINLAVANS